VLNKFLNRAFWVILVTVTVWFKVQSFASHTALNFIDDTEIIGFGAIGVKAYKALEHAVVPIIISTSLLNMLINPETLLKESAEAGDKRIFELCEENKKSLENKHLSESDIEDLLKKNETIVRGIGGSNNIEKLRTCIVKNPIRRDDFLIKKINRYLYLFVPYNLYLKREQVTPLAGYRRQLQLGKEAPLTERELLVGFKIDHMEDISFENLKKSVYADCASKPSPINKHYFIDSLSDIFVTRASYKGKKIVPPEWALCINGHGASGTFIAGLSIDDFKKWLSFCEKINTKLLIYSSCFASGVTARILYDEVNRLGTTYPFVIISLGLAGTAVEVPYEVGVNIHQRVFVLRLGINWYTFLNMVSQPAPIDFDALIKYVFSYSNENIFNSALIKFPGLEWFSTADINKNIISIGSVLAETRDRDEPLDIKKFFNQPNPRALLLYTAIVPFPLIINTETMPAIISMKIPAIISLLVNEDETLIKKISSSVHSLSTIIQSFFSQKRAADYSRDFFVREIEGLNATKQAPQKLLVDAPEGTLIINNVEIAIEKEQHVFVRFIYDKVRYEFMVPFGDIGTLKPLPVPMRSEDQSAEPAATGPKKDRTYKKIEDLIQKKRKEQLQQSSSIKKSLELLEKDLHTLGVKIR